MGNRGFGIDTLEKLIYGLETNCEDFFKGIKGLSAEAH